MDVKSAENWKRFVLHEHKAKKAGLHYDLRLEWQDGGVRSFAVRKELPAVPGVKRLAIEQPLHDQESLQFEGVIEEGYGAGELKKIDAGEYSVVKDSGKELILSFRGSVLIDIYVMINTGGDKWLLFKKRLAQSK